MADDMSSEAAADVAEFAQRLGVEIEAVNFLFSVPADLLSTIMTNFDPSGTKDGNVAGRLQGYTKVMMRRRGLELPADDSAGGAVPSGEPHHQPRDHLLQTLGSSSAPALPDVPENVHSWVVSLGLGDNAAVFIAGLHPDIQDSVMQGFDPAGTKDGNVWGRLLGFARSLWSRKLALPQEATASVRALPDELQVKVMMSFDPLTSKDGNVAARLMAFVHHLHVRASGGAGAGGGSLPVVPPSSSAGFGRGGGGGFGGSQYAPASGPAHHQRSSPYGGGGGAGAAAAAAGLSDFCRRLGLGAGQHSFLSSLPVEVQSSIMANFDPSGTKDGNVWGRLFAFARRVWAKNAGIDQMTVDQMKHSSEEEQQRTMTEWTRQRHGQSPAYLVQQPSVRSMHQPTHHHQAPLGLQVHLGDAPGAGQDLGSVAHLVEQAVMDFCVRWGLDGRAATFVQRLSEPVRAQTLRGFNGSGTKDGNVWGRLFGYVRQTWGNNIGLDSEALRFVKELPHEAQLICIADFDPSGTKDGNVAGRLQAFARRAVREAGAAGAGAGGGAAPAVSSSASAHSSVHTHISPQYASVLQQGHHPHHRQPQSHLQMSLSSPQAAPPSAPRGDIDIDGFMLRCSLDDSARAWLESLPEDIITTVLAEFDPSGTKDGNVIGRLQGYVRLLNARAQRKRTMDDGPVGPPKRGRYV